MDINTIESTTCIGCTYKKGINFANGTLPLQFEIIKKEFPEIEECYPGTINVQFDNPLIVVVPDHRTKEILWSNDYPKEIFDFLRVKLETNGNKVDSWIYIPHNSTHRRRLDIHEIIAPKITGIKHEDRLKIFIKRNVVRLPYFFNSFVVL